MIHLGNYRLKKIKTAVIPKRIENEMVKFSFQLNKHLNEAFKNQVLKKMNKSTINKFKDAQTGSYAKIISELVKEFKKKFAKRYSEKRIKKFIKDLYIKASRYNRTILNNELEKSIGIKIDDIVKSDGLQMFIEAKAIETTKYYQKYINETSATLETSLLRYAGAGMAFEEMIYNLQKEAKKGSYRAELIARNEIKTLNTQLTKKRAKKMGVKKAAWRGTLDERERECHRAREGKVYDIDKGCYHSCDGKTISPGEEINCRCVAELVVDDLLKKDNE